MKYPSVGLAPLMAVWGAPKPTCFGELFVVLPRASCGCSLLPAVSFWGVFLRQAAHSSLVDRRQQVVPGIWNMAPMMNKRRRSPSMRIKYNELLG